MTSRGILGLNAERTNFHIKTVNGITINDCLDYLGQAQKQTSTKSV